MTGGVCSVVLSERLHGALSEFIRQLNNAPMYDASVLLLDNDLSMQQLGRWSCNT